MDQKLLNLDNKEEWFDLIADKSIMQSQLFLDNKSALQEYKAYIDEHGEGGHFSREEADELFDCIMEMFYDDCDDYEILMKAIDPLIEFYTREHDFSRLVKLYSCRNYEMVEFWSRQDDSLSLEVVLADALSAISYKAYYPQLDIEARRKIFANYYNIVNVNLDKNKYDINLSYYYLMEGLNFYNSPIVPEEDRNDEKIKQVVTRTREEWLAFFEDVSKAHPQVRDYYMSLSDETFNKYMAKEGSIEKVGHEVVTSHYETMLIRGDITAAEGLKLMVDYYVARKAYLETKSLQAGDRLIDMSFEYMDYLYFFINVPVSVITWIETHEIPIEEYEPYLNIFLSDLHDKWDELYQNLPGPFLDTYIMEICLTLIPHAGDYSEQEAWLKKLLLKRHLPTFIHTNMVAFMAISIARKMLVLKPDILACERFPLSYILTNQDDILEFIKEASLFHDLGKARIGDIIGTQTRPISDNEFSIIRKHPSFGSGYIDRAPFLEKYKDVIIGHHKSYDGKSGYPADFDNTKSDIRPIIDLITICDCLDAATDCLSRNYSEAKSLDTVFREIYDARGSRYNPEIAGFLMNNPDLKTQLDFITGEGRIQKYYEIYEEYLAH